MNASEIVQVFCSHCGETKTYLKTDERPHSAHCKRCLQGTMIQIEK